MDRKTLADMRVLIGHSPKATRAKNPSQCRAEFKKAAAGAGPTQVSAALQVVLRKAWNADTIGRARETLSVAAPPTF
jgi:hypothetical protein